jgi:hypothetical protein
MSESSTSRCTSAIRNNSGDAIVEAMIADLESYLDCFNRADLEGIRRRLDENIQVYVDGKRILQGRETLMPSYQNDFSLRKTVEITVPPQVLRNYKCNNIDEDNRIFIQVTLVASTPPSSSSSSTEITATTCRVIYTYDTKSQKQIRHEIFIERDS